MELREIEAGHYRRQVNRVTVGFVMALAVLSVAFGAVLVALFGQGAVMPGESTGNFHLNLTGVLLALALCSAVLAGLKDKPFMADLVYVWQLKQMHNRIYRKLKGINAAAEQGDVAAMSVLDFYHRSREQVYRLDNNTLTLSAVARDRETLAQLVSRHQATLPPFDAALLDRF